MSIKSRVTIAESIRIQDIHCWGLDVVSEACTGTDGRRLNSSRIYYTDPERIELGTFC